VGALTGAGVGAGAGIGVGTIVIVVLLFSRSPGVKVVDSLSPKAPSLVKMTDWSRSSW